MNSVADEKILELVRNVNFRNVQMRPLSSWALRWQEMKMKGRYTWMQAKSGFMFGAMAGGCAGFVLGLPAFIKHRQVSILVVSTVVSGGFFAAISSFGVLIHQ